MQLVTMDIRGWLAYSQINLFKHSIPEVGLTSSAGVSVSKLLAKMVGSWKKPAGQTIFVPVSDNLRLGASYVYFFGGI